MTDETRGRREDDVLALAAYLDSVGAMEGIGSIGYAPASYHAMATEMEWSEERIARTVRYASDHPELGIAFHIKRGRNRMVVLTYDGAAEEGHEHVRRMLDAESRENVRRFVRSATKGFVRLRKSEKRQSVKRLAWASRLQEKTLRDMKFTLEIHDPDGFSVEIAMIENALAAA